MFCYTSFINVNLYMLVVGKMHWNKWLVTRPWPIMYMYFHTTQQNRCLRF